MNAGYLSYIALIVTAILHWSGWRGVADDRFSNRQIALFLCLWFACSLVCWKSGIGSGTLVYLPLMLLVSVVWASASALHERVSMVAFGMLLGAVYSLIERIHAVDPFLLFVHPLFHPALIVAALTVGYSRKGVVQLAIVSVALIVNDTYMAMFYQEYTTPELGSRSFQDEWWLAAGLTRMSSWMYGGLWASANAAAGKLLRIKGGRRT
ncbi:YphA family membrane protein [Paenibacillus thermotolerans]|uniref:YphA family membrane protein n=1 Tax=Paenibacillus thermotolerans TaxID=3027807 RepID=UPI0023680FEB|nr:MULTISPECIES: hypothetical protein [unclassified Paenibacillus]